MKEHLVVVATALVLYAGSGGVMSHAAHAAAEPRPADAALSVNAPAPPALPLPATAFPSHTRISYFPAWTNRQFDCNFGWFCDDTGNYRTLDTPYAHLLTEDALGRVAGWALWAERRDERLGFEVYSSVYSPDPSPTALPRNEGAAADEQRALCSLHGAKAARLPLLFPPGVAGGSFADSVDLPGLHLFFVTVWWGTTHEVEAAVLYPLKNMRQARHDLISQVRAAILAATARGQ